MAHLKTPRLSLGFKPPQILSPAQKSNQPSPRAKNNALISLRTPSCETKKDVNNFEHSSTGSFRMTTAQRPTRTKEGSTESPRKNKLSMETNKPKLSPSRPPSNINSKPASPRHMSSSLSSLLNQKAMGQKSLMIPLSPNHSGKISTSQNQEDLMTIENDTIKEKKPFSKKISSDKRPSMHFGMGGKKRVLFTSYTESDTKIKGPQISKRTETEQRPQTHRLTNSAVNFDQELLKINDMITVPSMTKMSLNLTTSNSLGSGSVNKKDNPKSLVNLFASTYSGIPEDILITELGTETKTEGVHELENDDLHYSQHLSEKASLDDIDNLTGSQEKMGSTAVLDVPVQPVENKTPKGISRRFVRFSGMASPNSTSESSNEDSSSPSESQVKHNHSPAKNSVGKILKPSSFAMDTFSKRVDTLDNQQNQRNRATYYGDFDVFTNQQHGTDFFDINKDNVLFGPNSCLDVDNIIRSSRRSKIFYGDNKIQPKFMEKAGSMCITELWSGRSKFEYRLSKSKPKSEKKKISLTPADSFSQTPKSMAQTRILINNKSESCTPSARSNDTYRITTISESSPVQRELETETPGSTRAKDAQKEGPSTRSMKSLFSRPASIFL